MYLSGIWRRTKDTERVWHEEDRRRGRLSRHQGLSQVRPAHQPPSSLQTHEMQMWLQFLLHLPENSGCERRMAVRLFRRRMSCRSSSDYHPAIAAIIASAIHSRVRWETNTIWLLTCTLYDLVLFVLTLFSLSIFCHYMTLLFCHDVELFTMWNDLPVDSRPILTFVVWTHFIISCKTFCSLPSISFIYRFWQWRVLT